MTKEHKEKIVEQFSKQAVAFKKLKGHYNAVDTIIQMSGVSTHHKVLDIACGTGISTCEFAKKAKNVIGLDITKKMIEEAIKTQNENNLKNIDFDLGDVEDLPYKDNTFDIVYTRYSFHHFLDTTKVFEEMLRVCKPDGKVIVVDVALEDKYSQAYNSMEKLRDPSHTKALTFQEFNMLFSNKNLSEHKQSSYKVDMELEEQLAASFPNKGAKNRLREIFKKDIKTNSLGVDSYLQENKIYFSYPITIFTATKFK